MTNFGISKRGNCRVFGWFTWNVRCYNEPHASKSFLYSFYVSLMHQYMLVRAFRLTRYLKIGSKNCTNHKIYFFGDKSADQLCFWKIFCPPIGNLCVLGDIHKMSDDIMRHKHPRVLIVLDLCVFKGPPSPQKIPIFAKNKIKDSITLIYAYYGEILEIGLVD